MPQRGRKLNQFQQKIDGLKQELETLRREKHDLEILLETTTSHSDSIEAQLYDLNKQLQEEVSVRLKAEGALQASVSVLKSLLEIVKKDKADLEIILETTMQHGDSVENVLYYQVIEAARRSEALFRAIAETSPVPVLIARQPQGEIIYANTAMGAMFDRGLTDPSDRYFPELFYESIDVQRLMDCLDEQGFVENYELEARQADNSSRWLSLSLRPCELNRNRMLICALYDVTERRRAEEALRQSEARLREQAQELELRVEQRTAELKESKETADAANRAKSEFLANMSHEFRTPLNAILGFTQLLSRDEFSSPQQRENLEIINRSAEHLLGLINDVLELSKIESGRILLHENAFELDRLLGEIREMLHLRANAKGIALKIEKQPNIPSYVFADESKLRQVLINLLSNAIKFTREGQVVLRVSLERRAPADKESITLHVEVEDTGVGIATEEMGSLFEAFVQTESGRQSQEGTGLGLRICKKYVQLMSGDIHMRSTLGVGTTFYFEIPIREADEIAMRPSDPQRQIVGLSPEQGDYRILLVDDSWENRQLLKKLLSPVGFEVREAADGKAAFEIWLDWQPHMIWLDIRLPVLDGYETTRCIRDYERDRALPQTAIVALTTGSNDDNCAAALAAGCNDFVRKPFRQEQIFGKIAEHLGVRYIYADPDRRISSRQSSTPTNDPDPSPLQILLAEDNVVNQKVALRMLKKLGYEADVAANGLEVLTALRAHAYELILMDIQMPEMDGLETTRAICREWENDRRPIIVAMTAHGMIEDRDRCIAAGMNDYISKPVKLEELKEILEHWHCVVLQQSASPPVSP